MNLRKLTALAAAAAAVGVGAFAGAASAAEPAWSPSTSIDTSRTYRITTYWSLALDVQGGSQANDAPVIEWPVNGGANQKWTFVRVEGRDAYQIRNVNSGKCLTVQGASLSQGAKLVQYACAPASETGFAPNQAWYVRRLFSDSSPVIMLKSVWSELWADVAGESPGWGTQLIQWRYHGWFNQWFALTALSGIAISISSCRPGSVPAGSRTGNGDASG
jgi:hypothetical protein